MALFRLELKSEAVQFARTYDRTRPLNGDSDWIELDFVEREKIPMPPMKLGIHLHVAE